MNLFRNGRGIAVQDKQAMASHGWSREQRRGAFFYRGKDEVGRHCFEMKVHWSRAGVQGEGSFSLAECGHFSLAGPLLGKEKIFLPFVGMCRASFFRVGDTRYTSSCWGLRVAEWWCVRAPPSGLPKSILNEVSFIYFHNSNKAGKYTHICIFIKYV